MMGVNPRWRTTLSTALAGDARLFNQEVKTSRLLAPSDGVFLQCSLTYAECGQQVYCIGPRLQQMFADTDCSKVPLDFLKSPHTCIYVALPECKWEIFGGSVTGMHKVTGFYLYERGDEFMVAAWGMPNEKARFPEDDASLWMSIPFDMVPQTKAPDGTALLDFETFSENQFANPERDNSDPLLELAGDDHRQAEQDARSIVRTAINLILYLSSLKAEQAKYDPDEQARQAALKKHRAAMEKHKQGKKRERAKAQLKKTLAAFTEATIVWIGKAIETKPLPKGSGAKTSKRGNWRFRKGHWHNYWTGPRTDADGNRVKGDKQVLKWTAPVYRDMGAIVNARGREHRFEEEKDDWGG